MACFLSQNGWTPLTAASCNGHLYVVKTLIEHKANVNQADEVSNKQPFIPCVTLKGGEGVSQCDSIYIKYIG